MKRLAIGAALASAAGFLFGSGGGARRAIAPFNSEQKARIAYYYEWRKMRTEQREERWQAGRRALLVRQARREKSGFYEGTTSVANALAHSGAGRLHRRVKIDDAGKRKSHNLVRLG